MVRAWLAFGPQPAGAQAVLVTTSARENCGGARGRELAAARALLLDLAGEGGRLLAAQDRLMGDQLRLDLVFSSDESFSS